MSQLRSDLALAFQAARAEVQGFSSPEGDLLEAVRRQIHAPMRFVDPDGTIQDAQDRMAVHIDALQELLGSADAAGSGRLNHVRQAACEAVEALKIAIFEHGCASAAADRVGLGVYGKRI